MESGETRQETDENYVVIILVDEVEGEDPLVIVVVPE